MKCKIITTSKQLEENGISLFDNPLGVEPELDFDPLDLRSSQISTITSYLEGEITVDGDDIRIDYHEDDSTGMGGVDVTIAFKLSRLDEVLITRSGEVNSVMLFAEGQRTISVYQTPFMPFELAIYAKHVNNQITATGGTLEIFYLIEIKGALAQRTELKLEIKKND